mgnify:CR=1 FL=1
MTPHLPRYGRYAKPVRVRVMFSHWSSTKPFVVTAMRALAKGMAACEGNRYAPCAGSLEVRQYEVPGWRNTTYKSEKAAWPAFTRVNHAKYIVSDARLNVGTSNWAWDYFAQTSGASWNTNETGLVAAAQAVFDADWSSGYATPV